MVVGAACSDEEEPEPERTSAIPTPLTSTPAATELSPARTGALNATATLPPATSASALPPAEPIEWAACSGGSFDCAEYEVPLDYDDPEGETITLALRRLAARDEDRRIGLLFVNPGGPGGSTIDILSGWARSLPAEIRNRFDIILMDPRGVGHSSPLLCHDNIQELIGLDPYPETDEDWQTIVEATREMTEACAAAGGDVLQHLGTREAARDIDRLREAEGEETVTYFGYSYGTTLGQVYADLFPSRVRAMVLDGAVDNSLPADQTNLEQVLGFEAAFQRYLDDCTVRLCFDGDPAETVRSLLAQAEAAPIPAPGSDRPAGPGEVLQAILGSLYSEATWSFLTLGINSALNGDADTLIFLADSFAGRGADGEYGNLLEAHKAVNCLDTELERDPAHHIALAETFEAQAPWFGRGAAAYGLFCAFWVAEPEPLQAPAATDAPPILVIGTTGDPATPYKWAVALAEQLESGVLVTRDGEGHLAYRYGDACIDDAVNAYLIELVVPEEGLVCGDAGIEPAPAVP